MLFFDQFDIFVNRRGLLLTTFFITHRFLTPLNNFSTSDATNSAHNAATCKKKSTFLVFPFPNINLPDFIYGFFRFLVLIFLFLSRVF